MNRDLVVALGLNIKINCVGIPLNRVRDHHKDKISRLLGAISRLHSSLSVSKLR